MLIHTLVMFFMAVVFGPAAAAQHVHHAPPADAQEASTTTLTSEAVQQLLDGEGMGLARPAELNRYPGPKHVIGLKKELAITPEQEQKVESIRGRMLVKARALGRQIVDAERALDAAFRSGQISQKQMADSVRTIATLQAELRTAHLDAHLQTAPLLTLEQVHRYYQLRGGHVH